MQKAGGRGERETGREGVKRETGSGEMQSERAGETEKRRREGHGPDMMRLRRHGLRGINAVICRRAFDRFRQRRIRVFGCSSGN